MLDRYGREIDYIRISVTDRCNERCQYCMPETGIEQMEHSEILTYDEIIRLCGIFARSGIVKVKITGGEPLVRKELSSLIKGIRRVEEIEQITITTNGTLLKEQIGGLQKAGIDAVNISLDALDQETYALITRRDLLSQVICGLMELLKYPHIKTKINCVPLRGMNEEQWVPLAGLARKYPIDVRFIEMMPIGLGRYFRGYGQSEVLHQLRAVYGEEVRIWEKHGNGPAEYVHFEGFKGNIGFISPLSHKFCEQCNRVRLTADGFLKVCLQYETGIDLKAMIRGKANDEEIYAAVQNAIYNKPLCHQFENPDDQGLTRIHMSRIGG